MGQYSTHRELRGFQHLGISPVVPRLSSIVSSFKVPTTQGSNGKYNTAQGNRW